MGIDSEQLKQGVQLAREGRFDEALELFQHLAETSSDNPEPLYLAGACHFKKRNYAEARKLWEQVLRIDPNHSKAKDMLSKLPAEQAPENLSSPAGAATPAKSAVSVKKGKTKHLFAFQPWMKWGVGACGVAAIVLLAFDMYTNPSSYPFLKDHFGKKETTPVEAPPKPAGLPGSTLKENQAVQKSVPLKTALPGKWFFRYEGDPATLQVQPNGKVTVQVNRQGGVKLTLDGTFKIEGTTIVLNLTIPNPQGPPAPQEVRLYNAVITGSELRFNINDPGGPQMLAKKQ